MTLLHRLRVVALAIGILFLGVTPVLAANTIVTDIRVGTQASTTRIVFEFTDRLSFRVFTLADPYRVVIDMPEVGWRLPPRPLPAANGVYERLRYGLYKPGNSRVVLDLAGPARIGKAALVAPNGAYAYRLVLEMTKTSRTAFLKTVGGDGIHVAGDQLGKPVSVETATASPKSPAAPPKRTKPAVRTKPSTAPKTARRAVQAPTVATQQAARFQLAPRKPPLRPRPEPRYTIVVDPGHGGVDPGTIGLSGSYEKHITLSMARDIRRALENSGRYKVRLTRNRDIFIPLRDRIRIARESDADLFVSIHADSIKNRKISGPAVYTLSEKASDKEAAALAEKENKADLIAGIDLTHESKDVANILIDLAQREAMNQSARFANMLIGQLKKRTKVLRNTHRFAGFAVLKAPDVPSVLLELGFLSNRQDERLLRSVEYRTKLAEGVAAAIDVYFARVEQAAGR